MNVFSSFFFFFLGLVQEVWLGNEELVEMYERRLGDAGYISLKLARTNNRGDGTFLFLSLVLELPL